MIDWLEEASALGDGLISLRRDFHRHPELGRMEENTARRVETELCAMGIDVRRVARTGIMGVLRGSQSGRCVALRADMDALPIEEQSGLPFSSEIPGVMHACGHDFHTAALLGTARLLSNHREELAGEVRFLFQPDEEGDGGAQDMIDEGCMDGVQAVFGAHVAPELPAGTVAVRPGKAYAASNPFDILVRGRGSHGAEPHLGRDAIVAASAIVGQLQTLVSRELDPLDSAVITIGSFHAGTARNIIADEARLSGILRCFGAEARNRLAHRLESLVQGIAAAHDVQAEVSVQWGYAGIVNDLGMTHFIRESAQALLGRALVTEYAPTLTTEDFGAFLQKAPGSYWHLGVGIPDQTCAPLHSPFFNPDESALIPAAALHAKLAMDFLKNGGFRA